MKQNMKRSRDREMSFSDNPQLNIMEGLMRKAAGPFRQAFSDIEQKLVTKEGAAALAEEINDKVLTFLNSELSKTNPVVIYGETDIPTEGKVWVAHACGSLVNLAHGREDVCIYMALLENGKAECALVFYPLSNDIFAVEKGKGAYQVAGRLRVSGKEMMENSLVSIFSPITNTKDEDAFFNVLRAFRANKCHTRISGNPIHDALTLGAGKLDAIIAMNLNPMDVIVAELFIKESGGFICETNGSAIELGSTTMVAANSKLQGKALKVLANA